MDVHYYEDGNVRMQTDKTLSVPVSSASTSTSAGAAEIIRKIAGFEKQYQEDLNAAFASLSEGAFKSLRRQLPITRQKVEWEKIAGYRVSFYAFLLELVHLQIKMRHGYRLDDGFVINRDGHLWSWDIC